MRNTPSIKAELTLLSESVGGKRSPLVLDQQALYRSHIVVGDASQRKPIVKDGNIIDEEYLGVQFRPCQVTLQPGESAILTLELMYYPSVEYEKVVPGAEFTLREGG